MREIVHLQAGQCGNQIGAKVSYFPPFVANFTHRSVGWLLSSGRLSRTSMASTQQAPITATLIYNWSASMCTTTKLRVGVWLPAILVLIS